MRKTSNLLLSIDNFYGISLMKCKIRFTDKIPTAAVRIVLGVGVELLINPEFFYMQSDLERVGLVWHELIHVICGHLVRYHGLEKNTANISMDESANQFIAKNCLPKRAILPIHFNHELNKPFEFYYNLHYKKEYIEKMQQKKYQGGVDDTDIKNELKNSINNKLDEIEKILENKKEQNNSAKNKEIISDQEEISDRIESHGQKNNLDKSSEIEEKLENSELNETEASSINKIQNSIKEKLDQLDELLENAKNRSNQSSDSSEDETPQVIDSHELWEPNSESDDNLEEKKEVLRNFLSEAIEETSRMYGDESIPAIAKETLKSIEKPKIKWYKVLRRFIGKTLINYQELSRKKPNRKFGYIFPGKLQAYGPKILIAIDCSGSVSDEVYLLFMAEVFSLLKEFGEKVMIIFFDSEIFKDSLMVDANLKTVPRRPLHGGTNFQCVMNKAEEYNPNLLIVLTDGEAPVPRKPKFPVLWAISGGRDNPSLFGERILIESNA